MYSQTHLRMVPWFHGVSVWECSLHDVACTGSPPLLLPCSYFDLTLPLLKQDSTLYCVSAWNYQVPTCAMNVCAFLLLNCS